MGIRRMVMVLIVVALLMGGCGGDERKAMIREAKRNTPVEQVR